MVEAERIHLCSHTGQTEHAATWISLLLPETLWFGFPFFFRLSRLLIFWNKGLNNYMEQRGEIYIHIFLTVKGIFFPYLIWLDFSASVCPGRNFSLFVPWTTHKPFTVLLCSATNAPPYRATCAWISKGKWLSRASLSRHLANVFLKHPSERCCPHPEENRIALISCIQFQVVFAFPTSFCKIAKVLVFS